MPWVKVANLLPQEGAEVLIHDEEHQRIECGRYLDGRWYVEDAAGGRPREIARVTHWAPVLDSESYDPADD